MTSEAMTLVSGSSVKFQITDSTRRCIDPEAVFNVQASGSTVAFTAIASMNFEFGEITFSAPIASNSPTLNGKFLPLGASQVIAEVKSFSLSESSDLLDKTVFTSTSRFRKRMYGLADATASLDILINTSDVPSLATLQANGNLLCLEILDASTPRFRGFGRIASFERSASVDGLCEGSVEWQLAATREETSGFIAGYTIRSATSS